MQPQIGQTHPVVIVGRPVLNIFFKKRCVHGLRLTSSFFLYTSSSVRAITKRTFHFFPPKNAIYKSKTSKFCFVHAITITFKKIVAHGLSSVCWKVQQQKKLVLFTYLSPDGWRCLQYYDVNISRSRSLSCRTRSILEP